MDMKLYKISQTINDDYDTYDSAVVCAKDEDEARHIHPSPLVTHHKNGKWYGTHSVEPFNEYENENDYCSWVSFNKLNAVDVEYLGEAKEGMEKGIVVASFNAG